jgi:hypothetical protein
MAFMWNDMTVIWLSLLIEAAYVDITKSGRIRRSGPEPKLSDVEVMTIEILGEMCGMRTDKQIYWYVRTHWRHFFPAIPCHQTFARQCTALSVVKQKILAEMFPPSDDRHVIDGFPIPICKLARRKRCRIFQGEAAVGYCAAKQEYFYGLRGILIVNSKGRIISFAALPGNADEREAVPWLYDTITGWLLADKGFISSELAEDAGQHLIKLVTPVRKNMRQTMSYELATAVMRARHEIETVISRLSRCFDAQTTRTRSIFAMLGRMARKCLAFNLSLACPIT